jgi:hypothetical protein
MKWLIITSDKVNELNLLNESHDNQKCNFVETKEGMLVTNADQLKCPYWADYHQFLSSLKTFEGTPTFELNQQLNADEQ